MRRFDPCYYQLVRTDCGHWRLRYGWNVCTKQRNRWRTVVVRQSELVSGLHLELIGEPSCEPDSLILLLENSSGQGHPSSTSLIIGNLVVQNSRTSVVSAFHPLKPK